MSMSSAFAGARGRLPTAHGEVALMRLDRLPELGAADPAGLPHTVKILLENLLRHAGTREVSDEDVRALAAWPEPAPGANLACGARWRARVETPRR
jgi:aconitate hydratase